MHLLSFNLLKWGWRGFEVKFETKTVSVAQCWEVTFTLSLTQSHLYWCFHFMEKNEQGKMSNFVKVGDYLSCCPLVVVSSWGSVTSNPFISLYIFPKSRWLCWPIWSGLHWFAKYPSIWTIRRRQNSQHETHIYLISFMYYYWEKLHSIKSKS